MTSDKNSLEQQAQDLENLSFELSEATIEREVQAQIDTLMPIWDFVMTAGLNDMFWLAMSKGEISVAEKIIDLSPSPINPYHQNASDIFASLIQKDNGEAVSFLEKKGHEFIDALLGKQNNGAWNKNDTLVDALVSNQNHHKFLNIYLYADPCDSLSPIIERIMMVSLRKNKTLLKHVLTETKTDPNHIYVRKNVWSSQSRGIIAENNINALQSAIGGGRWDDALALYETGAFDITKTINRFKTHPISSDNTAYSTLRYRRNRALKNTSGRSLIKKMDADFRQKQVDAKAKRKTKGLRFRIK